MASLEEEINGSISRVRAFYREQGVEPGDRPTYTVLPTYSKVSKTVLMQVPGELKQMNALSQEIVRRHMRANVAPWYLQRGVVLSEQAVDECAAITLQRLHKYLGTTDEDIDELNSHNADILIFQTMQDLLHMNPEKVPAVLDDTFAHEIWHVVEKRQGILVARICEGTAEFARTKYNESRNIGAYKVPELQESPARTILREQMGQDAYQQGLAVVKRHATRLTDLLSTERRRLMLADYESYISEKLKKLMEEPERNASERAAGERALFPEMDILDSALTKENLIIGLRSAGCKLLAEDLAVQDCTLLLHEYAVLGYGPTGRNGRVPGPCSQTAQTFK
jgi:hypothetical protein